MKAIHFFLALSDYNENNILRSKILRNLELKKYSNIEQCNQENGGILVHMHSPVNTEIYVIFQWTMKFLDLTWRIEHFFTVKSTDIGKNMTYLVLDKKETMGDQTVINLIHSSSLEYQLGCRAIFVMFF